MSRSHRHIEVESGNLERWSFGAFGDASLQARFRAYRVAASPTADSLWISAAVKLPTGAKHETNGDEEAEVTIQPSSGSTDYTLGATWQSGWIRNTNLAGMMGHATLIPFFASVSFRHNGAGTHRYQRGNEWQVNSGSEYPISSKLVLLGQVNLRVQSKDAPGDTGENIDLTGGSHLYVSPGLRFVMPSGFSAYGYVQVPVYEHVHGAQLVSHENLLIGIQKRF